LLKDFLKFIFGDNSKKVKKENQLSYRKKQFLLTKKELRFYNILKELILDKYVIMCSVRLIDIIEPANKKNYTARAKVIQKHIDFLICSRWYLSVCLIISYFHIY